MVGTVPRPAVAVSSKSSTLEVTPDDLEVLSKGAVDNRVNSFS